MKYLVPVYNISKLEKKVNRIKSKGVDVVFSVEEDNPQYLEDNKGYYHKCYYVEVEGHYQIDGWQFIATLEHTEVGNIIRAINNDLQIPNRFKHCNAVCEHCNTSRKRKDTYIVYNEQTKEFKQVGRTCLQDYTGLDADDAAQLARILRDVEENTFNSDEDYSLYNGYIRTYSSDVIKAIAYEEVLAKGYKKNETVNNVVDKYCASRSDKEYLDKYGKEIAKLNEWISKQDTMNNNYLHNAYVAWQLEYVDAKHLPLISSLISTYLKDLEEQKLIELRRKETSYVGKVGDRIEIEVDNVRVLYVKRGFTFSYYAEDTFVYKIVDTQGNIYVWSTATNLSSAKRIKATIVEHKEYKGEKQTVISRGKITEEKPLPVGTGECEAALEDFFKHLED